MKNSKILAASLAGAMILGASSFAFADPAIFNMVPADPPTTVGIDCTANTGVKNRGMIITAFKTEGFGGDASSSLHDDLTNPYFIGLGFDGDNVGDLWEFFAETFGECSTPAG